VAEAHRRRDKVARAGDKDRAVKAEGREIVRAEVVRRMVAAKVAVASAGIEVTTGVAAIVVVSKGRLKSILKN
jgi:plasmid stability protein